MNRTLKNSIYLKHTSLETVRLLSHLINLMHCCRIKLLQLFKKTKYNWHQNFEQHTHTRMHARTHTHTHTHTGVYTVHFCPLTCRNCSHNQTKIQTIIHIYPSSIQLYQLSTPHMPQSTRNQRETIWYLARYERNYTPFRNIKRQGMNSLLWGLTISKHLWREHHYHRGCWFSLSAVCNTRAGWLLQRNKTSKWNVINLKSNQ